jgi:tetratricopeptide (TPR) repeat protein
VADGTFLFRLSVVPVVLTLLCCTSVQEEVDVPIDALQQQPAAVLRTSGIDDACAGWTERPAPEVSDCVVGAQAVIADAGSSAIDRKFALLVLRSQARRLDSVDPIQAEELWEQLLVLAPQDGEVNLAVARLRRRDGLTEAAGDLAIRAAKFGQAGNNLDTVREARILLGALSLSHQGRAEGEAIFRAGVGNWSGTDSADGTHFGCAYQGFGELYSMLRSPVEESLPVPFSLAVERFIEGTEAAFLVEGGAAETWLIRVLLALRGKDYPQARELITQPDLGVWEEERAVAQAHLAVVEHDFRQALLLLRDFNASWGAGESSKSRRRLLRRSAQLALGWAHSNLDDHPLALEVFQELCVEEPTDVLAALGLGNSLLALNRLDEAEKSFDGVLRVEPQNRFALAERAMLHFLRGEDDLAESGFRAALAEAPSTYTCPYEGLGLLYLRQGRTPQAVQMLERAIDVNPSIEYRKYDALARIRMEQGQLDEAEALLVRSLENNPNGTDAPSLMAEIARRRSGP